MLLTLLVISKSGGEAVYGVENICCIPCGLYPNVKLKQSMLNRKNGAEKVLPTLLVIPQSVEKGHFIE